MNSSPAKITRRLLKTVFHQEQSDQHGNLIARRPIVGALNQRIMEHGLTPPWVFSARECQNFWQNIDNSAQIGNRPQDYAGKSQAVVHFLHDFWTPRVTPQNSILELGCNAGANLWGLHELGYNDLAAVEINPDAIAFMRETFPQLSDVNVHCDSLETVLPTLPSKSVDVIFTMAVLIHIHPSSHFIFREMTRIARRHIITVEAETANNHYVFARNYRRVFAKHGAVQIASVLITKQAFPNLVPDYAGYVARAFAVPPE